MSQLKSLAKDTVIYGISNILNRLLNFVIATFYLTNLFNNEQTEYGIYTIMYAYMALLLVLLTYGMETAFFRFGAKASDRERIFSTGFVSLLVSTAVVVTGFIFFSDEIAGVLSRKGDGVYVILFSLIIGFDVLSVLPFARLRLEQRPVRFAFYKFLNVVIFGATLLFFLELCPYLARHGIGWADTLYNPKYKLQYVFWANLISSIATFLMVLPMLMRSKFHFEWVLWKKMIHYALPLVAVGVTGIIVLLAGQYLIPWWLPGTEEEKTIQVGIWGASVKIATLLNLFTQVFKYAVEPFFFKHSEKGGKRSMYGIVTRLYTIAASLGFLTILLYIDVFQYLVGSNFRSGLKVAPVLLLAFVFFGVYFNFSIWYKLTDKTRIGALISTAGMFVSLIANYWLIPHLGIMGAAWASLISYVFLSLLAYVVGQRYYPIPFHPERLLVYIGLAMGTFYLSQQLDTTFSFSLIPKLIVHSFLIILYLGLVALFEKNGLVRELRKGIHR